MSTPDLKKVFGDNLRRIRGSNSQSQFAAKLGVSQPMYARWEGGGMLPRADRLKRIAQTLSVTEGDLLSAPGTAPAASSLPWPNGSSYARARHYALGLGMSVEQFAVECVMRFGEEAATDIHKENRRAAEMGGTNPAANLSPTPEEEADKASRALLHGIKGKA